MKVQCLSCAAVLLTTPFAHAQNNVPSAALNTTNNNLVPNPDGRVIYYNATGDTPSYHETSPDPYPITPVNSSSALIDAFYTEILGIATGSSFKDNCSQCIAGAELVHFAALTQPVTSFVELLIRLCNKIPAVKKSISAASCEAQFGSTPNSSLPYSNGAANIGTYMAQSFSKMSIATGDFQTYCHNVWSVCPETDQTGIDESMYFSPKPDSAKIAPTLSGQNINVLHLSDWHIDPRYDIGSEANCTGHLCCRPYSINSALGTSANNASLPASRFGSLLCDSPPDLALSAFQSMPQFFDMTNLSFSIFTGDIVSHDQNDQLSQAYVSYEEEITYNTFKAALGNIPVYATLGNHDSYPQALNTPNSLDPNHPNALSWNYQLLSSLWSNASWLPTQDSSYASTHYGAYATTHPSGLRIISLNTDFWYKANPFNYINTTNPDPSGILTFLTAELQKAESSNQRVWIIGHVLSGYDGSNPLIHPTSLFYSIVVRFSPSTIAAIFFGHTHMQQIQIFYDFLPNSTYTLNGVTYRNTTMLDYSSPLTTAYIGPSIVPLTNLNAGYTLYQVDSTTFSVTGLQTYFANISNTHTWTLPTGPIWELEYDAATAYAPYLDLRPSEVKVLDAFFWDNVTHVMERNGSLVEMYSQFETKSSVVTGKCGGDCGRAKVCYMRSGSAALGRACPKIAGGE